MSGGKDKGVQNGRPGGLSSDDGAASVSTLRASIPDAVLDDKGRCCGRKPIPYKRDGHWFCDRCSRSYAMASGRQIANWTWLPSAEGFYPRYPDQEPYRTMLAQAMETRRAGTEGSGAKHDSAVAESDAP